MDNNSLPSGLGHEACNKLVEELMLLVASQRELLQAANQTIATLNSLMALTAPTKTEKRRQGRPTKNTDDSFLVEIFNNKMRPEFIAANRDENPTDTAVLNWYFTKEYARYGWSASRVRGKVFQSKLKTFKNRLGDARNSQYKTSH